VQPKIQHRYVLMTSRLPIISVASWTSNASHFPSVSTPQHPSAAHASNGSFKLLEGNNENYETQSLENWYFWTRVSCNVKFLKSSTSAAHRRNCIYKFHNVSLYSDICKNIMTTFIMEKAIILY